MTHSYNDSLFSFVMNSVSVIFGEQLVNNQTTSSFNHRYKDIFYSELLATLDLVEWEFTIQRQILVEYPDERNVYYVPANYIKFVGVGNELNRCDACTTKTTRGVTRQAFDMLLQNSKLYLQIPEGLYNCFKSHSHIYFMSSKFDFGITKGVFIKLLKLNICIALAESKHISPEIQQQWRGDKQLLERQIIKSSESEFKHSHNTHKIQSNSGFSAFGSKSNIRALR